MFPESQRLLEKRFVTCSCCCIKCLGHYLDVESLVILLKLYYFASKAIDRMLF